MMIAEVCSKNARGLQKVPGMYDRKQAQRRRAIGQYHILDSDPEPNFDAITMLVARICKTQSAAISLIDDDRQWFKSACGFAERETPLSVSFCVHAIESKAVFVVKDARLDPRFASNPRPAALVPSIIERLQAAQESSRPMPDHAALRPN